MFDLYNSTGKLHEYLQLRYRSVNDLIKKIIFISSSISIPFAEQNPFSSPLPRLIYNSTGKLHEYFTTTYNYGVVLLTIQLRKLYLSIRLKKKKEKRKLTFD